MMRTNTYELWVFLLRKTRVPTIYCIPCTLCCAADLIDQIWPTARFRQRLASLPEDRGLFILSWELPSSSINRFSRSDLAFPNLPLFHHPTYFCLLSFSHHFFIPILLFLSFFFTSFFGLNSSPPLGPFWLSRFLLSPSLWLTKPVSNIYPLLNYTCVIVMYRPDKTCSVPADSLHRWHFDLSNEVWSFMISRGLNAVQSVDTVMPCFISYVSDLHDTRGRCKKKKLYWSLNFWTLQSLSNKVKLEFTVMSLSVLCKKILQQQHFVTDVIFAGKILLSFLKQQLGRAALILSFKELGRSLLLLQVPKLLQLKHELMEFRKRN